MFEHCIWYELHKHHPLHLIIRRCATLFRTQQFPAHMTVHRNKTRRQANHLWHVHVKDYKRWFFKMGEIYQTHENNFYAIQQDFSDFENTYHISIAYRYKKPFTPEECLQAAMIFNIDEIKENDTFVSHHLCASVNPKEWKRIR